MLHLTNFDVIFSTYFKISVETTSLIWALFINSSMLFNGAFQVALVVKNLLAKARDRRDASSIPGSGRSPGGGHGNPLQCSCLENPMDRGACQGIVHRVTKSRTRLKQLSTQHSREKYREYNLFPQGAYNQDSVV